VDVAASATEDVETEDEVTAEVDEDPDEVVTSPKRRNGSQSPSWVVWSRPERSRAWSKSTYTLSPSRSIRSSTGSYLNSKTRS
jgi:hypothetical protein